MRRTAALLVLALLAAGCSNPLHPATASDSTTPPKLGACRPLEAPDLDAHTNDTKPVPCSKAHTAETFLVGSLPASTGSSYGDRRHGTYVFRTCTKAFQKFLGADESLTMRIRLSWAWFRPSEAGWKKGARWFRCDVVGGAKEDNPLRDLPRTAKALFRGRPPEKWLTCARGDTVLNSIKVPCTKSHNWRAVATIKLGGPATPYPGDRIVEVRTRDYCSDQVGAWMNYPTDYEFGYTWFHRAEWQAGNRRSICWAKTER